MGRPVDPSSKRQVNIARRAERPEGWRTTDGIERDFEFLQTVATLNGGSDVPAPLSEIAKAYSCSKQAIHSRVKRLRARGWLEENDERERKMCGVRLTHNGKLLVETGLGSGLTE